jgi:hypothetical protein
MAVVTSFTTYTGKQSEFRELVMKKLAGYARVDQLGFQLVEDVQSNKIMYKDNYLDKITKKFTTCQNTETGTGIAVSSFTLSVANMQAQLEQCAAVFDSTIAEIVRKKGADINDLTGTEIEAYVLEKVAEAAARDLFRVMFLGDTTLSNSDYTQFDGVFKKIKAGYLAGDGTVYGGTVSATDINTSNIVNTLDSKIYDVQPYELKFIEDSEKVLLVTDNIYKAWVKYLSSTAYGIVEQRAALVNGLTGITYRGIPMVSLGVLDKYIATDFATGSPAAAATPYRAILTKADNHYLATDTLTSTSQVQMWYDQTDDKNYTRLRYKAGYNYAFGELNVFAGF